MSVILMLLLISFLIIAHEFGHFWVARRCGIRVEKFGFGLPFGPVLWSKKVGETEYCVYAALFGGFVAFPDDDPDSDIPPDSPERLENKTVLQRFAVMVAGVAVNAFLAWAIMLVVVMIWGIPKAQGADVYVASVAGPKTGAAVAGIRAGDRIVNVDGLDVNDPKREQITRTVFAEEKLTESSNGVATLTVLRKDKVPVESVSDAGGVATDAGEQPQKKMPARSRENLYPEFETEVIEARLDEKGSLGVPFVLPDDLIGVQVGQVPEKSAAALARLQEGDRLLAIGVMSSAHDKDMVYPLHGELRVSTERVKFVQEIISMQERGIPGIFDMTVERGEDDLLDLKIMTSENGQVGVHLMGGVPVYQPEPNILKASEASVLTLNNMVVMNFMVLGEIVSGHGDPNLVGGPARIVAEGGKMIDEHGIQQGLRLTAIISIILAVMNLLPIPALDGGHIFFLIIEAIKGSPVKKEIQEAAVQVGFIALMLLMVVVVVLDVYNLTKPNPAELNEAQIKALQAANGLALAEPGQVPPLSAR